MFKLTISEFKPGNFIPSNYVSSPILMNDYNSVAHLKTIHRYNCECFHVSIEFIFRNSMSIG